MALSDRKLKRWYNAYNRRWFDGLLPTNTEIWYEYVEDCCADVIHDGCTTTFDESSDTFLIRINPAIAWSECQVRFALLHEMVHIATGRGAGHGPRFQLAMIQLAMRGAFRELW